MHNFKELNIWKQSMDIAVDVNRLVDSMPKHHIWGLGSQLLKTAVSVPSNIAEGCGRKTNEQFLYFLNVALASTFELETQIILAVRFETVESIKADEVLKKIEAVQKMTNKLVESIGKKS